MTTFFLVRHGVTAHTGHRLTGWMEGVHLTDEGLEQARVAAEGLAHVDFDAIFASPIDRTLETAQAIADRQGKRVRIRKGIGEVRYGKWTNRSFKTLVRTKLWATVQRYPSGVRFPDGETLREVQTRAVKEVEGIRLDHPKETVCVVSHADVIKLVAAHYLGVHIDLFQRIEISPASFTVIAVGEHGPRVLTVNSVPGGAE